MKFEEKDAPWYVYDIEDTETFIKELDNDTHTEINEKFTYFDGYDSPEEPQSLFRFALDYNPEAALHISQKEGFTPDMEELKDFVQDITPEDFNNFVAQSIKNSLAKTNTNIDTLLSKDEAEKILYNPSVLSTPDYSDTVSLILDHPEVDINQIVKDDNGFDSHYSGRPLNFLAYAQNKEVFEKALNRPKTNVMVVNSEWDCDGIYYNDQQNPIYKECKKLLKNKQALEIAKNKHLASNLSK